MIHFSAARISSAVYKSPNYLVKNAGYNTVGDWKFLEAFSANAENGYFGAAFMGNNTIIVAHRGTEVTNVGDLINDIDIILGEPLSQLPHAIQFSKNIEEKYGKSIEYVQTGHSLGALLAEIVGVKLNRPVISFEAPGAFKTAVLSLGDASKIDGSKIVSYVAMPNFINTAGEHIANTIYSIHRFTNPDGASVADYIMYSIAQHSMDGILSEFSPITALPNYYHAVQSSQWPLGFYDGFRNFLNDDYLWNQKAQYDWRNNIALDDFMCKSHSNLSCGTVQDEYKSIEDYKNALDAQREDSIDEALGSVLQDALSAFHEIGPDTGLEDGLTEALHHLLRGVRKAVSHPAASAISEIASILHGIYGDICDSGSELEEFCAF